MDLLHCRRLAAGGVWGIWYKFLPSPAPPSAPGHSSDLAFFDVPRKSEKSAQSPIVSRLVHPFKNSNIHSTISPTFTNLNVHLTPLSYPNLHISKQSSPWVTTAPTTTAPFTATIPSPVLAIDAIFAQHQKEALPSKTVFFPKLSDGVPPPHGPPMAIVGSSGPAGRLGIRGLRTEATTRMI
ncbi:hypothetical protein CORC01_04866 [Colletotrichum orchidophilum]|uniref:Uncharacterized protein n=1 Tax=Colletotrichum orchidophilum TaxID=1209926 RepID=A0A1G4BEA9_9PEZI|nr:uncharacterized protein CORC01_04866 [Colletotrichum orchidophilum]OHE99730.1 hypothetical protein CORC01_04866 [Colletotrichum orchidophilum]